MTKLLLTLTCLLAGSVSATQLLDPTRPAVGLEPVKGELSVESTGLVLNAVLINGGAKTAVINQQAYQVGQRVSGMRINYIDNNQVRLENGRVLTLFTTVTKN
ncbi:MSHA biogenesis protein MshK [Paraferrimonas sedimenticola]|nr:MSHA biogenesis protein MshK [Paraferrimonas sedimenticola]